MGRRVTVLLAAVLMATVVIIAVAVVPSAGPTRSAAPSAPAASGATAMPTTTAPMWSRIGPAATVCAVAAGRGLLAASFVEGSDTAARCQLLLTADGGRTWTRQLESESVVSLASAADGTIFVGTIGGAIWRITQGRPEIVYAVPNGTFQPVIKPVVAYGGRIFAGGRALLTSDDKGAGWQDLTPGLGNTPVDVTRRGRFAIGDLAVTDTAIAVVISDIVPEGGVWVLDRLSRTWARATLPSQTGAIAIGSFGQQLLVSSRDGRLLSTTDDGRSWSAISQGLPSVELVALTKSASVLIAGADRGAFIFRNARWEQFGPPELRHVRAIAIDDDRSLLGAETGLWSVPLSH